MSTPAVTAEVVPFSVLRHGGRYALSRGDGVKLSDVLEAFGMRLVGWKGGSKLAHSLEGPRVSWCGRGY